jgi:hypothetical protein
MPSKASAVAAAPNVNAPWEVGKTYLVRTVTMMTAGHLVAVYPTELVFKDAAWIADSGRWHECLKTGKCSEVEPFVRDVIVGRGAIVDATEWPHPLPLALK